MKGYLMAVATVGLIVSCTDQTKSDQQVVATKQDETPVKEKATGASVEKSAVSTKPTNQVSTPANPPHQVKMLRFVPPTIVDREEENPEYDGIVANVDNWSSSAQQGSDDYYGDAAPEPEPMPLKQDVIYEIVDEPAEFPGGMDAMRDYLKKNMMYPAIAKENGIQGKCYLRFVVNTEGSISDVRVLRGVAGCPECDKEATRVVKNMPKWKPGKMNGKDVKMYFTLPIAFKLT
jgi:protein TonB